jgi:hypothetical protein
VREKSGEEEVGRRRGWWAQREGGPTGKEKEREGEEGCWAGPRGEGERGFGKFFLKTFSNSHFKLLKLNSFQNTPRFSTFLKAFKTSHKKIIKPCIQIMMHKHLLLLNY